MKTGIIDVGGGLRGIMKASSALPFVCKPYPVQGSEYFDGALGDPIPIGKAFELGCDRVVLILTKPEQTLRTPGKDMLFARGIQRKYPVAAESLRQRARRYNGGVAMAQEYARQGRMLIVAPDDTCGIDTLKKDRQAMEQLYEKGYADGKKITDFFRAER